ncbi:hypothetical protein RF11_08687 [Thelohanellus kitauei]|uniref:MD-2-related lipid-recognition domain-containing protein n=1 Tax=Thelohanellus kitauei TaxID=669202 RepID=A0A0C2JS61_THEKT|nr:hypothetical protein RF11_08687 [Thelohanellus kitauei]
MNVNFFVVLTAVCSMWKVSHCQLYHCTLRVDKIAYVINSSFLTECTKDKCLRKPGLVRTLNMTFTPLVFSKTAKMTVEDYTWSSQSSGSTFITVDLCSRGYIACPVLPNVTYTIQYCPDYVWPATSGDPKDYGSWTTFKITNEEDIVIGCIKSLASPDGVTPVKYRCS